MAPNQRKAPQRRAPKAGWLLGCFGFPLKSSPSEGKKARKSSGRKRWFKLCLSKIRVVNVRRKKASLDAKAAALKATQSIMLEASKVQQRKLHSQHQHHHALGAQDQLRLLRQEKEIIEFDSKVQKEQSDDATRYNEDHKSKAKHACTPNVSKDSLIGMSIMLTTLVIMGIWGKLCAILCMCAWFYCVPLLRVARDFNHNHVPRENDRRLHLASKLRKVAIGDP